VSAPGAAAVEVATVTCAWQPLLGVFTQPLAALLVLPLLVLPAPVGAVGAVAEPVILPVQPASGQLMAEEACPVPAVPGSGAPPWAAVRPLVVLVVA
jgi:hypothetical protein